jgi:hypothetical protein
LVAGASVTVAPAPDLAGWNVTVITPAEAAMQGDLDVANLLVRADDQPRSAWVPLVVNQVRGRTADGVELTNGRGIAGGLYIVHQRPVLMPRLVTGGARPRVGIQGLQGRRYRLEVSTAVVGAPWQPLGEVLMTGDYGEIEFAPAAQGARFYRLVELP